MTNLAGLYLVVVRDPADNGILRTFGPYAGQLAAREVAEQKRKEIARVNIDVEPVPPHKSKGIEE